MDDWGWQELQPWLELRVELPIGPLFCVINGATGGRPWATAAARAQLRRTAAAAGVRRRFAPHQLRHAHAVEMAREGVPLIVIQRRPQQPRHHLRLPPGHRQRRNHRHRPRPTRTDDRRQRIAPALKDEDTRSSRKGALSGRGFADALFVTGGFVPDSRSLEAAALPGHRPPLPHHEFRAGLVERRLRLSGNDCHYGKSQPFDSADQVTAQPLGRPLGSVDTMISSKSPSRTVSETEVNGSAPPSTPATGAPAARVSSGRA